jgi:hypothetical protein
VPYFPNGLARGRVTLHGKRRDDHERAEGNDDKNNRFDR